MPKNEALASRSKKVSADVWLGKLLWLLSDKLVGNGRYMWQDFKTRGRQTNWKDTAQILLASDLLCTKINHNKELEETQNESTVCQSWLTDLQGWAVHSLAQLYIRWQHALSFWICIAETGKHCKSEEWLSVCGCVVVWLAFGLVLLLLLELLLKHLSVYPWLRMMFINSREELMMN